MEFLNKALETIKKAPIIRNFVPNIDKLNKEEIIAQSGDVMDRYSAKAAKWEKKNEKKLDDLSFPERILKKGSLIASSFFDKIRGVEMEKAETTAETAEVLKQTNEQKIDGLKKEMNVESIADQTEKQTAETALAVITTSFGTFTENKDVQATALDALKAAAKGEEVTNLKSGLSMAALSIDAIIKLKETKEFDSPEKFEKMLEILFKASEGNDKFGLKKLFSFDFLTKFKAKEGKGAGLKILTELGKKGIDSDVLIENAPLLKEISKTDLYADKDKLEKITGVFKQTFFKNSDESKVKDTVLKLNKIARKAENITPKNLTEIVFNTNTNDFKMMLDVVKGSLS